MFRTSKLKVLGMPGITDFTQRAYFPDVISDHKAQNPCTVGLWERSNTRGMLAGGFHWGVSLWPQSPSIIRSLGAAGTRLWKQPGGG